MRLIIELKARHDTSLNTINKYYLQSIVYNSLRKTDYDNLHKKEGYKFFCFTEIFSKDKKSFLKGEETAYFIVSSPDQGFIKILKENLENKTLKVGINLFEVINTKIVKIRHNYAFQTSTPVVVQMDKEKHIYWSLKRADINKGYDFFIKKITKNAIDKYETYYQEESPLKEEIFDIIFPKKDVVVLLEKNRKKFVVIGTMWKLLRKVLLKKGYRKFYNFVLDVGIGEKNSLGFGFLNPLPNSSK